MAKRSRRDNSFEIAKFTAVLIFLGVFALTGGKLESAAWFFIALVIIICICLGVAGIVLYFLFRRRGKERFYRKIPQNFKRRALGRLISDSEYASIASRPPERFTKELLTKLEWRRFEMLVQSLFQAEGMIASRIRAGADGGIDLELRESPHGSVVAIVQCKAWNACVAGVKPIRELFGVMHAENVPRACFFTSGNFSSEARTFATGKPIDLVDGNELLLRLNSLEKNKLDSLLTEILQGDYTTPTCPSCDTKMVLRTSRHGEFWGCLSYPRCKQSFRIRK